jgi:hypothetical protein
MKSNGTGTSRLLTAIDRQIAIVARNKKLTEKMMNASYSLHEYSMAHDAWDESYAVLRALFKISGLDR